MEKNKVKKVIALSVTVLSLLVISILSLDELREDEIPAILFILILALIILSGLYGKWIFIGHTLVENIKKNEDVVKKSIGFYFLLWFVSIVWVVARHFW